MGFQLKLSDEEYTELKLYVWLRIMNLEDSIKDISKPNTIIAFERKRLKTIEDLNNQLVTAKNMLQTMNNAEETK